ncbi:hypothetical protein MBLNU230_g7174t1 [Neophaeotheca triangularis]
MTHLLRGKQAGIQNDLSAGLSQDHLAIDDLARYGINSQTSALAYDPVQSLLAVGTKSSQFGPGQIYVFGRGRICVTLPLARSGAAAQTLQFCADKLVCLDSKHDISVYSLDAKRLLASHSPPGVVTAIATDPMIDYCILGMQTGDLLAYDLDRENLAPFKVPNLWQAVEPKARVAGVQTLQFHPRDIGTLLIGFTLGAAIYDFKLNKAKNFFPYEIPKGAPGGDGDPTASQTFRRPKLVQAVWHPTGTFILTGYEDSSLVFWDVNKDGRMLMARTLTDTDVATPGNRSAMMSSQTGTFALKEPIFRISWCANGSDPDDTGILIAGGASTQSPAKGLTFFELGRTPVYNTATWDLLSKHFESPKRTHVLPTPPRTEVVDFCIIPRSSPHYAGAHDPIAVIALMASGELITLSFPSGIPVSPTNYLHPSITFVHPFIQRLNVTPVERERWLGFTERRQHGPPILKGGAEAPRPMRRFENRNVVQTIHADGTIRLWDIGHGDEIENENMLQADVARAVNALDGVRVTQTSFAPASSEMAVGVQSGELVVFRWNRNRNAGKDPPQATRNTVGALTNVIDRVEPSLSEGLLPFTLLNQGDGPVTAVKMSEVGFVAAGFQGGSIAVIDLRGPAIIYNESMQSLTQDKKRSIRRKNSDDASSKKPYVTSLEFSVMTLENEDYSSILLHAGTSQGHLATFKIVPDPSGRYTVQHAGSIHLSDSRIFHISPIHAETGRPALATQQAVGSLRSGNRVNGALVTVTASSAHISRPATSKGAHKSFDSFFCDSAAVARYQDAGHALLGLFGDGYARAYSLPALREIGSAPANTILDVRRFPDAVITPQGTVVGFTGPSEIALLDLWGTGDSLIGSGRSGDKIFNPEALIPPRPTISNVQWLTGTQYVTPADMDILIGGPDRPPSKRMVAQSRADEEKARAAERANIARGGGAQDEGYWAYMQRQVQERTEKLGMVGDSMEQLEQNSSGWVNDVNKFVGQQKRGLATSFLKSKMGF